MKTALILIDIQNDYFEGGKSELYHALEAANNAKKVLMLFRQLKLPVFHIQHIMDFENAPFFEKGTAGAEIHDIVKPLYNPNEKVIIKHVPNSFFGTSLKGDLENSGITNIVVCGMMTHMCVDTTVRASKDLGLQVALINDACATKDLIFDNQVISATTVHNTYMASLNGMFANIMSTEKFIESFQS